MTAAFETFCSGLRGTEGETDQGLAIGEAEAGQEEEGRRGRGRGRGGRTIQEVEAGAPRRKSREAGAPRRKGRETNHQRRRAGTSQSPDPPPGKNQSRARSSTLSWIRAS